MLSKRFEESYQNLYILSEEPIKENDWVIDKKDNILFLSGINTDNQLHWKVIGTTNTSLNLPNIPQDFINHYISEYNKGNIIEEVEVEYEENYKTSSYSDQHRDCFFELKILFATFSCISITAGILFYKAFKNLE